MNLTKLLLSKKISKEIDIANKQSHLFTDAFFELLKNSTKSYKKIKLSEFGTFGFKKTPKRMGRNPKTKVSYIIPPMKKLSFIASNVIRKKLN
tara:strand:+ start:567 stop:845 length:279 start_codon:yes stop_codon:yes gene_type:complete